VLELPDQTVTLSRSTCGLLAVLILTVVAEPGTARTRGPGVIRGTVSNRSTDSPQAGVEVVLTSALEDGTKRFTESATTDASGRYIFSGLPNEPERVYALDASHDGGLFASPPIKIPPAKERTVIETTIPVWNTISDPDVILIQRHDIFVNQGQGGVGAVEALHFLNTSGRAYVGRAASFEVKSEGKASIAFALPPGATRESVRIIDSGIEVPRLIETDFGFGIDVAIPPGETQLVYSYRLEGTAGAYNLTRTALYPTLSTTVHAPPPFDVSTNRLAEQEAVTVGDTRYARWSSTRVIDAGESLQISAIAEAGSSGWLAAGIAVTVLLGGVLLIATVARNRRRERRLPRGTSTYPAPTTRDELVTAIAQLDIRYEAGELPEDKWKQMRADLKARLAGMSTPERTP
jgi:hypothetical protein